MPVEAEDPASAAFRLDHYPPRLVVAPGTAPRLAAVGFEVRDHRELEKLVESVHAAGVKTEEGTAEERAARRVTGMARFEDPAGVPVELFYGPVLDHVPVHTPLVSRFVTGSGGMGHLVVGSGDARAAVDFYIDVLGFAERNTMATPMGDMWFLSPNPRHHTLGLLQADGPAQLFHVMLEVGALDDLGRALDRIRAGGIPLQMSLGRHTNDHMVSFYVYTPDLTSIELGWGGLEVVEDEPTYAITAVSFWGHHFSPPPSEWLGQEGSAS
jgi:3,4-dihydroxy-9,10-secoandrosta-1,3,5(10)-triene-9,17-dione 4,5-dioxygenase